MKKLPNNPTGSEIERHVQFALDKREDDNQYQPSPIPNHDHDNVNSTFVNKKNLNWLLPSQSGNAGDFLTTDGNNPSWSALSSLKKTFTAASTITGVQPVSLNIGPITFDNNKFTGGNNTGTFSTSFTVGNNNNRVLVACVALGTNGGNPTISSVTYNGASMTPLDFGTGGSVSYFGTFLLFSPSTGSNTFQVNSTNVSNVAVAIYSYYNCAQSSPGHGTSGIHSSVTSQTNSISTTIDQSLVISFGVSAGSSSTVALGTPAGFVNNTGNVSETAGGTFEPSVYGGDTGLVTPPQSETTTVTLSNNVNNFAGVYQVALSPFTSDPSQIQPSSASNSSQTASFVGFSTGSIATGSSGNVIINGVVTGLSGLTSGSTYYLANSSGTISTSPGTVTKKVGIALSSTSLLIQTS